MPTSLRILVAVPSLVIALAIPASATAATVYVDDDSLPSFPCGTTSSDPCQTIGVGLDQANPGDTVQVDGGDYNESVTVDGGRTLLGQEFRGVAEGMPVIEGAAGSYAVVVGGAGAPPTVSGFSIHSPSGPMRIDGSGATVETNVFDEETPPAFGPSHLTVQGDNAVIRDNAFSNPVPGDKQAGISVAGDNVTISGNTFSGLQNAIRDNFGTGLVIDDNTITGTNNAGGLQGYAIQIGSGSGGDADATLTDNEVSGNVGTSFGIYITDNDGAGPAGVVTATLKRNRLFGNGDPSGIGVVVQAASPAVTMDSDVVAGWGTGVNLSDSSPDSGGDVLARNVTVVSATAPFKLDGPDLTLDSSIVAGGAIANANALSSCTITFSRGPAIGAAANGCDAFQTAADPDFVSPETNDYHLQTGSPLIDAGNPAAPAAGSLDFEGDARAIVGICGSPVRRDIGADEFDPGCVTPPVDTTPPNTVAGKFKKKVKKKTATFKFSSEAGATFVCKLDKGASKPCTSPYKLTKLKKGKHVLLVTASDAAGNADATPAQFKFKVVKKKKKK